MTLAGHDISRFAGKPDHAAERTDAHEQYEPITEAQYKAAVKMDKQIPSFIGALHIVSVLWERMPEQLRDELSGYLKSVSPDDIPDDFKEIAEFNKELTLGIRAWEDKNYG